MMSICFRVDSALDYKSSETLWDSPLLATRSSPSMSRLITEYSATPLGVYPAKPACQNIIKSSALSTSHANFVKLFLLGYPARVAVYPEPARILSRVVSLGCLSGYQPAAFPLPISSRRLRADPPSGTPDTPAIPHLGIEHRGTDGPVAQEFLDRAPIAIPFQSAHGGAMTQGGKSKSAALLMESVEIRT